MIRAVVRFNLAEDEEPVLAPQDPIHFQSEEVETGGFPLEGVVGVCDREGNFRYYLVVDFWSADEGDDYFCIDAFGPVQEW